MAKRRNQKSGKTQTAANGGQGKTTSTAVQQSRVQVVLKSPEPPVQQQREGKTLRLHQKELVVRMTGLERVWGIPLHPGRTGAPRLDALARQHAWTRWKGAPRITYRSLSTADTNAICSYLVVHDATLMQVTQPTMWDTMSRQYTSNKASASFTHSIDLTSMVNTHLSNQSDSCSWFLFKFDGPHAEPAELWLEYDVEFGGVAELTKPSITFHVKDGKFYEEGATKPLDGYPVFGRETSYHFGGAAPTHEQVKHLLESFRAVPLQITRPNSSNPTVSKDSPVREVSFHLPQALVDVALATGAGGIIRKAYQVIKPLVTALVKKDTLDQKTFNDYNGTVTVQTATHAWYATGEEQSVPPVPRYNLRWEREELREAYPLLASYSRDNSTNTANVIQFLKLLSTAAVAHKVEEMFRKLKSRPVVVHRGHHAMSFLTPYSGWIAGVPDLPEDNQENPNLPDIPENDGDIESPGTIVPWSAAQKFFSGYVVDDNGTPITHYLTAERHGVDYFSAITPRYYYNLRRPWDTEDKRLLAFQLKVSEALRGHYLLMEGYNWGDDACASWLPAIQGGTYMGVVARFSGLTESRSVIRVDDPNLWNQNEVHLVVGQAKGKYRKADKGRASLFAVRIGAVGLYEVAKNYLAISLQHKSVTRMMNHPLKKGSGAGAITTFSTHTDVNVTRAEPDPNLDPNSPGFGLNYHSMVNGERALPYPVEDGPVRLTLLARYDNQNGWWQHVPDAAWTDTDVASYWTINVKMDGTKYTGTSCDRQPYVIASISAPRNLAKDAYLCEERISLGGSEYGQTTTLDPNLTTGGDLHVATGVSPGPLMITRRIMKIKENMCRLVSVGDSSRPTTAVDGYDDDRYVAIISRYYLVKNEEIAKRWALWDQPGVGESLSGWKWFRPTYKLAPGTAGNPWSIGDEVTGLDFYVLSNKNAPCSTNCSAFSETGYSETVAGDYNYLKPGEVEAGQEGWGLFNGADGALTESATNQPQEGGN